MARGAGREILKKDEPLKKSQEFTAAGQPDTGGAEVVKLPKIIRFDSLARCGDEVWIENNGQIYRLRRTRQGKLILTK